MKIRQIRFQNIKSYIDQTINFNEGVNFISGVNGAGKTTIIEGIGYALFNSKPGVMGEFLRYGQKTGIITIEFEANDNRLYRVIRKFGNVSSWLVFDVETESEIDLHGSSDVEPFLKEIMGIEADQDCAQLFEDIIGVGQGTFTAPFLESPAGRREKFNRIFRVESYRAAFGEVLRVIKRIEDITRGLEKEKAKKIGGLQDYEDISKRAEELLPVIGGIKTEIEGIREKKGYAQKDLEDLKEKERQVKNFLQEIKVGEERVKGLGSAIEKLKTNRGIAMTASGLVEKNKGGYTTYINIKKEQGVLEKQRRERDGLKDNLGKREAVFNKKKGGTETESNAINLEKMDIEKLRLEIEEALEGAKRDRDIYKTALDGLSPAIKKKGEIKENIEELEKIRNGIVNSNIRLRTGIASWEEIRGNIEKALAFLSKENEINNGVEKLKRLREEDRLLRGHIAAQGQKLKTLRENLDKTTGGLCPFLGEPCLNVDGGLDAYFSNIIKEQEKLEEDLEVRLGQLTKSMEDIGPVEAEVVKLNDEGLRLKSFKEQELKYSRAFSREFQGIRDSSLGTTAGKIIRLAGLFNENIGKYHNCREQDDLLKDMIEIFSSYSATFENFTTLLDADVNISKDTGETLLDYSENLMGKATDFAESAKKLQKIYDLSIEKEQQTRNSDYIKSEQNVENAQKQMEGLALRGKNLAGRVLKLEKAKSDLRNDFSEISQFKIKLEAYTGLDEKLDGAQEGLNRNTDAYNTYMKNLAEAEKLDNIIADIKENEDILERESESLKKLKQDLCQLEMVFSEEKLSLAEKLFRDITVELAKAEKELQERSSDLEELNKKLDYMDGLKKEIHGIDTKLDYYDKVLKTTAFIRNLLKKAGERISVEYRKYLAMEANKIYREVSGENVEVQWREGYDVFLVDTLEGRKRERCFRQLSGGEQMTAALAMRLGLLKQLSGTGVGFFDEPTTNLDGERRSNLAQIIPRITGDFDQLFVISHDDSFDAMTENVVQLRKDSGEGTRVV